MLCPGKRLSNLFMEKDRTLAKIGITARDYHLIGEEKATHPAPTLGKRVSSSPSKENPFFSQRPPGEEGRRREKKLHPVGAGWLPRFKELTMKKKDHNNR